MSSSSAICPICEQPVDGDAEELERHVNNHLDLDEEQLSSRVAQDLLNQDASSSANLCTTNDSTDEIEPAHQPVENAVVEDVANDAAVAAALAEATQITDSHEVVSSSLRGSLRDSAEQYYPDILRVVLPFSDSLGFLMRRRSHMCTQIDLYTSNTAGMGWDCGYRNIQMMFSSLLNNEESRAELSAAGILEVPSIQEIAGRIEDAWQQGYDAEGAKSFGGKLVGKEVWIGATEAFVLFRSIKLNAQITDFETPCAEQQQGMFAWVGDYFDKRCNKRNCYVHRHTSLGFKKDSLVAPLFCQWQGHSITIVGTEKTRGNVELLVLDPSQGFYTSLMSGLGSGLSVLQKGVTHPYFLHPRFQIVSIYPKSCANEASEQRGPRRRMLGKLRLRGPT